MDQRVDALGSAKERLVLAALALDAGRPVSVDTLIHRLWDGTPPARPLASLHAYVARIRRRLRALDGSARLLQRMHTYELNLDPQRVDCHRFQNLVTRARSLSDRGDDREALLLLRRADELWRGEPLTGLTGLWAEHIRDVLKERRLSAQLTRADIGLRLGRYADLVPDLTALLDEHPTDESLAARLMTAAYGCGRQADALRVYESVRRRLRADLGTDPGEALVHLHRLILNGTPAHALLARPEPAAPAPCNLPGHGELVGRERELATILHNASPLPPATATAHHVVALQSVSGMAGVGKSLLALHAAGRLAPLFPDGLVHLDLRTHAPGQAPLTAEAALTTLIRTFGIPAADVPHDLDGLVALWRSVLRGRRAVVVLDDVAGAEQLRTLLPGASPSLVIVTSRRRLAGLPGIRTVELDVLPAPDAITLFRAVAGEDRTRQTGEVAEIVRLTGYLPLGVELAAARLASRPAWTTSHLLRRLSQGQSRLKEIRDSTRGEIARAFDMSYRALTDEERKVFRLLGLRFGPAVDPYTVAALSDLSHDAAEDIMESLHDAHLIQEPAPDRYTLHDLLGEYARALALREESNPARTQALHRVIHFYVQATDTADRILYPRGLRPDRPRPAARHLVPHWPDAESARHWLTAERTGLLAAERHCRDTGHPREAALLAGALAGFLDDEGHSTEAQHLHGAAVQHWSTTGEQQSEVHALIDLGNAQTRCNQYEHALTTYERALRSAQDIEDINATAEALHQLGVLNWHLGRLTQALDHQLRTLHLRLLSGDPWQAARCRNNLGITHIYLGNYEAAQENFDMAVEGFRKAADTREYARALNNLSDLHLRRGDPNQARQLLREALHILNDAGSPSETAITQVNLANTMESPGELATMLDLYQQSLTTFRRLGDHRNASETLHAMGLALHTAGRFDEAAARHRSALETARGVNAAHEEAQALHALGRTEHRLGQVTPAATHLTEAIEVAERIGASRVASQARESLADLTFLPDCDSPGPHGRSPA